MNERKVSRGRLCRALSAVFAAIGFAASAHAAVIVNDTWADGTRTDPASPTYSENGTDSDADGSIESAWFTSPTAAMAASVGHLTTTQQTGSSSYTTYFSPAAGPVTLSNAGDQLKITWAFTPNGVNSASAAQGLRVAVVDWPEGGLARLTADGAPGTPAAGGPTYHGYALFGNMKTGNLGNGNSFQLLKRADTDTTPLAFLSASAAWTATGLTNSTTNNTTTPGYTDGAPLTFVMTLTRTVGPDAIGGNADDGIALVATMTGTGLGAGNQGFLTQSATDSAPSGFVFDTFGLRPSTVADTATTFDTTNFKVEGPAAVPEPAFLGLAGSMGLILFRRRYRD